MKTKLRCCENEQPWRTITAKNSRVRIRTLWLLFAALFLGGGTMHASHFVGGEITYRNLNPQGNSNVYEVTLRFFRDCSGITFGTSQTISVSPTSSGSTFNLPLISTTEITPLCPGQVSRCSSSSSTVFGVQEVVFRANITLNPLPAGQFYTISQASCCRNPGITRLVNSSNQGWYLETTLNPTLTPRNSSPTFLNPPVSFFCVGQSATISPTASDIDGDDLSYSLVSCRQTVGTNVDYAAGFSGTTPLSTTGGLNFNTSSGELTFIPNAVQSSVVCVRADEFRNGVLIGSIVRDIQIVVQACNNACPVVNTVANQVVNVGQTFCVNINATDADLDNVTLTLVSPVGTFTPSSAGAGFANGQFCFTPLAGQAGNTYTVTINARDNSCPATCTTPMTFNITVPVPCVGQVTATSTPAACGATNGTATATATGFTPPISYSWSNGASTSSISNLAAGTYSVTVVGGSGCVDTTTVVVAQQGTSISVTAVGTSPSCPNTTDGSISVAVSGGTAPFTYFLNGGSGQSSNVFNNLGIGTYLVTATDANGCGSAPFTVSLQAQDLTAPAITCPGNLQVGTSGGQCSAVVTFSVSAQDNCPGSVSVAQTGGQPSGSTFGIGTTTNTFVATDAAGNTATCSFTVTVSDDDAPTISCPSNISVNNGAGICGAVVNFGAQASDNCPGVITSQTAGLPSGSTFGLGTTTNTFLATDAAGNTATCSFTVTVVDAENPTISCPSNISVNNDAGICGAVVNFGAQASDNCPGVITSQTAGLPSGSTFGLGTTTNTFVATDGAGNTATCSFTVTVVDAENPTISCPGNLTVNTDAGTCGAVVTYGVQAGDNCPGVTTAQTAGQASGTSFPLGSTTNTFTATDAAGNTATCSFTITVVDAGAPTISCPSNIAVANDPGVCGAVVTYSVTGSDNCPGAATVQTTGLASGSTFPVGTTTNTFTVTAANGQTASCSFTVSVSDTEAPNALCQNVTVSLNPNGQGSITTGQVNNGSTDNCSIASLALDRTTFSCTDVAGVVPTITDLFISEYVEGSGQNKCLELYNGTGSSIDLAAGGYAIRVYFNGATSFTTFNLSGTVASGDVFVFCQQNATAGFTSQADQTTNAGLWTGDDAVVLVKGSQVLDIFGRIGEDPGTAWTAAGIQTSERTLVRNATVAGGVTSNPAAGFPTLSTEWTSLGTDVSSSLGSHTYNAPVGGGVTVTLTVVDVNGNTSNCTATVTVLDQVAPAAICQDVTVQLDANGNASVTAQQVDNGSNDACGIDQLSLTPTAFNCSNVGNNAVTLTVTDVNGNTSTCSANVTVEDNIAPNAVCQNVTIQLDANGNASVSAQQVNGGSTDNCAIANLSLDNTAFGCGNVGSGNTVTLTVTDVNGNVSTCTATITVEDQVDPVAICQDITVQLDANGNASIVAAQVDGGSTDNCAIASLTVSDTDFDCSDIAAVTPTGLFISEYTEGASNNKCIEIYNGTGSAIDLNAAGYELRFYFNGSTSANTVIDLTGVVAAGDVYVVCDDNAIATFTNAADQISTSNFFNGNDAVVLAINGVAVDIFGRIGEDPGTQWAGTTNHTMDRTLVRAAHVWQGISVNPGAGFPTLDAEWIEFPLNYSADLGSHTFAPASGQIVTLTVTDVNGNSSACEALVQVEDLVAPNAICQNVTVQLDANGNASITAQQVDNGSNDACGIASLSLDNTSFGCQHVGQTNTVTLTVTDVNGNVSTCTANITVEDLVAPNALCQNVTVQLDANGNGSITAQQVDNGSNDACGIASLSIDNASFGCQNVGSGNTVTLTVTDVNGNVSTCSATVTVEDNVAPNALCQDVVVFLDANGAGSTNANSVDNGSNDACGIASLSLNPTTFGCQHVGGNTVTLTVTDVNGNVSTCTATATVIDSVAPVALCQNVTVTLDNQGNGSITAQQVDNGSNDACGIASLTVDPSTFGCEDLGANTVTLTVTDVNGNVSTCTAIATVEEGNFTEIQCPADITANCETGEGGAYVTWDAPTAIAYTSCSEPCSTVTNICGYQSLGTYGGSQYFISNSSNYTWAQANAAAMAAGGHLVVINDAGENNFLNASLNCNYIWIGYTDQASEGNFDWVNGDADTYTNWQPGEPNNGGGSCCYGSSGSDFAVFNSNNGRWYDRGGCDRYAFVIEISCPNTVTIAQIGGPAPGSLFPEGTTVVTYVATNNYGTTDTCSFNVTVEARFEIVCPTDINLPCQQNNGHGNCGGNQQSGGRTVTWADPTVIFDNCSPDACPSNVCIPGFSYLGEYNGHRYYYRNGNYSWGQAFTAAQNAGGHLATINDAGENSFIANSLNASYAWIGLNDAGVEGTFRWSNNEPVSYTNWQPGEPNNNGSGCCGNSGADYAVIRRSSGRWYDQGSCSDYGFVMEVPCFGYTLVQTDGPASGSFFAEGTTTTIGYMAYTSAGDTVRCSFDVTIDECPPVYCSSQGYNTCSEWIENVTICDVNNTSGNDGGYGDYTNLTATLVAGQQYTIQLTPGYSGNAYREYWRVGIDWNRDGDFNDAQELAFQGNGYGPGSGTITVPTWASNRPIRMRVSMRWNGYASSPCSNFQYGEVEDYTIVVLPGGGLKTAPAEPEGTAPAFVDVDEPGPVAGFEFAKVYPNPVIQVYSQVVNLEYRSGMDEEITIRVMDLNGKVLLKQRAQASRGVNQQEVNISKLAVGTYLLEVSGGTERTVQEIVVQ